MAPLALVVVAALTVSAPAQTPTQTPTPITMTPSLSLVDSAMSIVEIRSIEAITQDIQDMAVEKAAAETRIQSAKGLQARADTEITVKQTQIKSLEVQIDLAKKDKDDLRKREIESHKKLAELEKQLLERRKALRDREIAYWEKTRDYVEVRRKCYDAELNLAARRGERELFGSREMSAATLGEVEKLERDLQDLERKTLEAEVTAANKRQEVSKQETEMVKARKQIFEAQLKLKAGG